MTRLKLNALEEMAEEHLALLWLEVGAHEEAVRQSGRKLTEPEMNQMLCNMIMSQHGYCRSLGIDPDYRSKIREDQRMEAAMSEDLGMMYSAR